MALTAAALALGAGATVAAAQAPKGASLTKTARGQTYGPIATTALEEQTQMQALFELGAPAETVIENFLANRIGAQAGPHFQRGFERNVDALRAALAQGDERAAKQYLDVINRGFKTQYGNLGMPAPAIAKIENGQLTFEPQGPEGLQIAQYAEIADEIYRNRLQAYRNIAEIGARDIPSRGGIREEEQRQIELELSFLDRDIAERTHMAELRAQKLGTSPEGVKAKLEEQRAEEAARIRGRTGLERALTYTQAEEGLLSGGLSRAQSSVNPQLLSGALQARGQEGNIQTAGANLAGQLAQLSAQMELSRAQGITRGVENLGATLLYGGELEGGLGTSSRLSSTALQGDLGVEQEPLLWPELTQIRR
jgi:hypothetical protein